MYINRSFQDIDVENYTISRFIPFIAFMKIAPSIQAR